MALLISGSMYSIRAFPLKSPAICCAFLWIFIEPDYFESMIGHIQQKITAHHAETNHTKIK